MTFLENQSLTLTIYLICNNAVARDIHQYAHRYSVDIEMLTNYYDCT